MIFNEPSFSDQEQRTSDSQTVSNNRFALESRFENLGALICLVIELFSRRRDVGVRVIFFPGGEGGEPFSQKILASFPNFYKTVEKKRGPYDAT